MPSEFEMEFDSIVPFYFSHEERLFSPSWSHKNPVKSHKRASKKIGFPIKETRAETSISWDRTESRMRTCLDQLQEDRWSNVDAVPAVWPTGWNRQTSPPSAHLPLISGWCCVDQMCEQGYNYNNCYNRSRTHPAPTAVGAFVFGLRLHNPNARWSYHWIYI